MHSISQLQSRIQRVSSPPGFAGRRPSARGSRPPTPGQKAGSSPHAPARGTSCRRNRVPAPAPKAGEADRQERTYHLPRCWWLQASSRGAGGCLPVGAAGNRLSFSSGCPTWSFLHQIRDDYSFKAAQLCIFVLEFGKTAFRRVVPQHPWVLSVRQSTAKMGR